jgi:ankyrin repeat protein
MCTEILSTVCSRKTAITSQLEWSVDRLDIDFAKQYAIPEDGLPSAPASQKRILAPAGSHVHEEFVRAAAEGQHTARLGYLLAQGADVDAKGEADLTALYNAAFRGDLENVRFLLDSGADVNSLHEFAGTPICIAALRSHADVVETLLSHKANLVTGNDVMGSAMHCACFSGVASIFKGMLAGGARMDHRVFLQLEMLCELADKGFASAARQVLLSDDEEVHSNNHSVVCSPLLLLVHFHHAELLNLCWTGCETQPPCSPDDTWYLVADDRRAPGSRRWIAPRISNRSTSSAWSFLGFSEPDPTVSGSTLLMWAAASLRHNLVDHLLVAGANVEAKDKEGWTALHFAAEPFPNAIFGNVDACVKRLVEGGADINMPDVFGQSPLMYTVNEDHPAIDPRTSFKWGTDVHLRCITAFLDQGALINATSTAGGSVLLCAISSCCQHEIIELVCKHGAALDVMDCQGRSALDLALSAQYRNEATILTLLEHGANPNQSTTAEPGQSRSDIHSPPYLCQAISQGASDPVIIALLEHGANPDELMPSGLTPRDVAGMHGRLDLFSNRTTMSTPSSAVAPMRSTRSWLQRVYEPVFRNYGKPM